MLKKGGWILSFWFLFNALPGVLSLGLILSGKHAPAFQYFFKSEELSTLEGRVVATVDGLAIIANTLIVTYCVLSFFVVRKNLMRGEKWALFVLSANVLLLQIAAYWSDAQFSGKNFWIVNLSSLIFLAGLALCAAELVSPRKTTR